MKGKTLDKVINNFSKLTINKLARKTAKLLKIINSIHKNKVNENIKEDYVDDRIRRIYHLREIIARVKKQEEINLYNFLIKKMKEYEHYFYKMHLVFSHGDYHFTNLVYYKNKIYAIDFNRCGYEFYLQDLVKLYFFDNNKNNFFVKKTIRNYFNPNNKKS
ncbi:phosphotransferase [bacterium]|nr:phosphotransferase [bacterium]